MCLSGRHGHSTPTSSLWIKCGPSRATITAHCPFSMVPGTVMGRSRQPVTNLPPTAGYAPTVPAPLTLPQRSLLCIWNVKAHHSPSRECNRAVESNHLDVVPALN